MAVLQPIPKNIDIVELRLFHLSKVFNTFWPGCYTANPILTYSDLNTKPCPSEHCVLTTRLVKTYIPGFAVQQPGQKALKPLTHEENLSSIINTPCRTTYMKSWIGSLTLNMASACPSLG